MKRSTSARGENLLIRKASQGLLIILILIFPFWKRTRGWDQAGPVTKPGLTNTYQKIPVKTSNPGRNPS